MVKVLVSDLNSSGGIVTSLLKWLLVHNTVKVVLTNNVKASIFITIHYHEYE